MKGTLQALLAAVLALAAPVRAEEEELDEMSLMFDLEGMSTAELRVLADKILRDPEVASVEAAVGVIAQPKLNDAKRATALFRLIKDKVEPDQYDILADTPLLQDSGSEPVVAALVIKLIGLTRNPEARETLLNAVRRGHPSLRGAAAHAVGYFGDPKLLPVLEELHGGPGKAPKDREYADGLVRGMLLLGDFRHFPGLVAEQAKVSTGIVGAVMQIASHFSSPQTKRSARKRLAWLRKRRQRLREDIVEVAPKFPVELARYLMELTGPNECDVMYRLLPRLVTADHYQRFIPVLRAKCQDLRQLVLDLLLDGEAGPADIAEIRKIVMEWYEGEDPMGRLWALRNCRVFEPEARRKLIMDALRAGDRWERVEAILEVRRAPDQQLLAAALKLSETTDPDLRFYLARLEALASSVREKGME